MVHRKIGDFIDQDDLIGASDKADKARAETGWADLPNRFAKPDLPGAPAPGTPTPSAGRFDASRPGRSGSLRTPDSVTHRPAPHRFQWDTSERLHAPSIDRRGRSLPKTRPSPAPPAPAPETTAEEPDTNGRIQILDGIRGIALCAVILYHAAPNVARGGFLGVEAFFVLSGYLLASLLLQEHHRHGKIDRRAYGERRFRRIAPALVVFLFGLLLIGPLFAPDDAHRLQGDVFSSLAGLTNWWLIRDGSSYFTQLGRPSLVRHLWSIAIEIQFYLVCPFLVGWLVKRSKRTAVTVLLAAIGCSAALMSLLYSSPDPSRAYFGTDARIGALLAGVLLAVLMGHAPKGSGHSSIRWTPRAPVVGLAVLLFCMLAAGERSRFSYPAAFLATQAATMLIIAASVGSGAKSRVLEAGPLRWLGIRSYGIYLWHWPAVALLRPGIDIQAPRFVTAAIGIAISVVLGALSYRLVEQPFLKTRRAGRRSVPRPRLMPGPAVVGLALIPVVVLAAKLPAHDPIAASLRTGQKVLAQQKAAPASARTTAPGQAALPAGPAPGAGSAPAPAVAAPAAPAPPPPAPMPAHVRVTSIADSVMVSAAAALQPRLGPSGFIDAKLRRHFKEGIETARAFREQGRLGDVVVVHLGNNGPVKERQVEALLQELAPAPHILLVTVRVDRPWQDQVNQVYAAAAARHPKVKVVDWSGLSGSHPEWFQSDGTHLKPSGARAYADLVAGSLPAPPPPPLPAHLPTITLPAAPPEAQPSAPSTATAPEPEEEVITVRL